MQNNGRHHNNYCPFGPIWQPSLVWPGSWSRSQSGSRGEWILYYARRVAEMTAEAEILHWFWQQHDDGSHEKDRAPWWGRQSRVQSPQSTMSAMAPMSLSVAGVSPDSLPTGLAWLGWGNLSLGRTFRNRNSRICVWSRLRLRVLHAEGMCKICIKKKKKRSMMASCNCRICISQIRIKLRYISQMFRNADKKCHNKMFAKNLK